MSQNLDLEAALRAIEYKPLATDPTHWIKNRHVVTLRGGVFYDTLTGRGGRTATDLFMAVENIDLFTAAHASDDLLFNRDFASVSPVVWNASTGWRCRSSYRKSRSLNLASLVRLS